jgi:hypothetical protein
MDDLAERIISLVNEHPQVRSIELVGSRASGRARPGSDWDFRVEAHEFRAVANALPDLLRPLNPLAQQWDRLSDEQCWMLIVRGPAKVDLIFPEEPHVHEPPWQPSEANLAAIDAHFWDWMLWLHPKDLADMRELVAAELQKLFDHLLKPFGADRVPTSILEAVGVYRAQRDGAGVRFGVEIPRQLESEVARVVAGRESGIRKQTPSGCAGALTLGDPLAQRDLLHRLGERCVENG